MLHRWLNEPGVVRWWEGDDVSRDAVVRDYGSRNDEPIEHWIVIIDGNAIGWIQCYAVADFDNDDETEIRHWLSLGYPRTGAGTGYLMGNPADRGRGLGSELIRTFVQDIVFGRHPTWTHVAASPYDANQRPGARTRRRDSDTPARSMTSTAHAGSWCEVGREASECYERLRSIS